MRPDTQTRTLLRKTLPFSLRQDKVAGQNTKILATNLPRNWAHLDTAMNGHRTRRSLTCASGARPDRNLTGSLRVSYGLPYGLRLKKDQCLCGSLRVYGSNTPSKGVATVCNLCFIALACSLMSAHAADSVSPRERLSFNADWRFTKGDPADSDGKLNYQTLKPWLLASVSEFSTNSPDAPKMEGNPGADVAYTQRDFDDRGWRQLNLPHDWGIEGPFKQEYPGETGKLPWWGVAWYRKHFDVPASDAGKQIYLDVDGAMAYAAVWLNGQFVGGWPYGYSSWRLNLTPYIKTGMANVLAIRLDNPPNSSRWYPGGGIYRNVWLVKTAPVHVAQWGTFITTPEVTKSAATVALQVKVENSSAADTDTKVSTEIYELNSDAQKARRPAATFSPASLKIGAGATASASQTGKVSDPKLWSVKKPNRYLAVTTIEQGGKVVDVYETPFGIRTIKFTVDNGFMLNAERLSLNGVCDHHDLGALGSAINTRALERQLQILRDMGCTAIRTSHNPPAPELLDLCDRMGFVVMDETFDCWVRGKTHNDYHLLFPDWHEKDVRMLVRRDHNHPCVILWSIGNEIAEQGSAAGHKVAAELAAIVHSEDTTRPVTAACNNTAAGFNGFQNIVDVFGYNYKPREYGKVRQANPALPLFGSETASCISSRGEYFFPVSDDKDNGKADFQMSSYDIYAPRWATIPDAEFRGQDEFPYVAGEFVWTGFDYLGEPTPYNGDMSNLLNFTDPDEK